jgi:DNA adenine methylase
MLTRPGRAYVEPFVGGANVLARIPEGPPRLASDANAALIHMWRAVAQGWEPPDNVTREQRDAALSLPDENPLKAFMRIGCGFAGNWTSGYAADSRGSNYAKVSKSSINKIRRMIRGVIFDPVDYRKACYPKDAIVYCDPPYAGTTGYGAVGAFDSSEFWRFFTQMSLAGRLVVVSEYAAPEDWPCVWQKSVTTGIRGKTGRLPRVERLFVHRTQLHAYLNR